MQFFTLVSDIIGATILMIYLEDKGNEGETKTYY
jgi:hypothetical protein